MKPSTQLNRSSAPPKWTLPILLIFACVALLPPNALGVVPAPDGGYPNGNTAEGENALLSLTTGGYNTANGWNSLYLLSTGSLNTGIGAATLFNNTADQNTATGAAALFSNTTGLANTANGAFALLSNTTGNYNTATGLGALQQNTAGSNNSAYGSNALYNNTLGYNNTAVGANALFTPLTFRGSENTAVGIDALGRSYSYGYVRNTAVGYQSLSNLSHTSGFNIAIAGGGNLVEGDLNIYIGNDGYDQQTDTIRIGSTCCQTQAFIAGIHGTVISGGTTVYVNSDGQLGTSTSSIRFKDEVRPMDKASEAILALGPVSFRYKKELDPNGIPQFGLVAEEVEKINPDLVVHDANGKPYTVRYEQINAMLLNEFLKEHRKIEQQEQKIEEQQRTITQMKKAMETVLVRLKEHDSKIEQVNDELKRSKIGLRLVAGAR